MLYSLVNVSLLHYEGIISTYMTTNISLLDTHSKMSPAIDYFITVAPVKG